MPRGPPRMPYNRTRSPWNEMRLQGFGVWCDEGGCQVLLGLKEMADKLLEIYDELNYPGTQAFLKELRKRGIPAREKDVRDFV